MVWLVTGRRGGAWCDGYVWPVAGGHEMSCCEADGGEVAEGRGENVIFIQLSRPVMICRKSSAARSEVAVAGSTAVIS